MFSQVLEGHRLSSPDPSPSFFASACACSHCGIYKPSQKLCTQKLLRHDLWTRIYLNMQYTRKEASYSIVVWTIYIYIYIQLDIIKNQPNFLKSPNKKLTCLNHIPPWQPVSGGNVFPTSKAFVLAPCASPACRAKALKETKSSTCHA